MPIMVEGTYENGTLKLDIPASVHRARVIAMVYEESEWDAMPAFGGEADQAAWIEQLASVFPQETAEDLARLIDEAFESAMD